MSEAEKAALDAYWAARTPEQERVAYRRMMALDMFPSYGSEAEQEAWRLKHRGFAGKLPVDDSISQIKPCPFCGGAAAITAGQAAGMAGSTTWLVYVECGDCKAKGPPFTDGAYQPEDRRRWAVEAWNRRI